MPGGDSRRAPATFMKSALAEAVEILIVAQEKLAGAGSERGVAATLVVVEDVVGDELELGSGHHHVGSLELRREVELAVGKDRRGPDASDIGSETLLGSLAGGGILDVQDPTRFAGPVQIAVVIDRRRGVGTLAAPPQDVTL